jgi:hypothetical protein
LHSFFGDHAAVPLDLVPELPDLAPALP